VPAQSHKPTRPKVAVHLESQLSSSSGVKPQRCVHLHFQHQQSSDFASMAARGDSGIGMGFLSRAKVWQAPYRVLRPCICICRNACDVVSSREQSWRCHAIDGLAAFPRQLLRAPSPSGRPTTCVVVVDTTHLPLPATPPGSGLGHEGRGPKLG